MAPDVHERLQKKLHALFAGLVGERAERLSGSRNATEARKAIESALKKQFGAKRAWEIAFHLSDWGHNAAFILAMHLCPERFRRDEVEAEVLSFVIHAPNHIAAAAHWYEYPITDVFDVGLTLETPKGPVPMPAGYSGTPLAKKLGIKSGFRVFVENAPDNYRVLLEPLPDDVAFLTKIEADLNMIHLFTASEKELAGKLKRYIKKIKPNGTIWVSWPKKASKVPTDLTEDVIRELALKTVLVDVKVCAVDEVWSGLKLVIRVGER
jgi:hypothetical protein